MSPEVWKQSILKEVSHIADKNYQKKAWFGKGKYVSSLDEMYATLFEDFMFEDFLEQHTDLLTAEQRRLGKILLHVFDDYYDKNMPESEEVVIKDPNWDKVIDAAKVFSDSCVTAK